MSRQRTRSFVRGMLALLAAAAAYEAIARSGLFPRALLPVLPKVAETLLDMLADGSMLRHAFYTLSRLLAGLALAACRSAS
jgi:ABC-type nitrate/sulfonate/bicarbonate transport system permease component